MEEYITHYITKFDHFLKELGVLPIDFHSKFRVRSTDNPLGLLSVNVEGGIIYVNYYEKMNLRNTYPYENINSLIHEYCHILQYSGKICIVDNFLTPSYIYEGYAHYFEEFFVEHNFMKDDPNYDCYLQGYYRDTLMRLYRYHMCYLYHQKKITPRKMFRELNKFYKDEMLAENETFRILVNPYICSYFIVKEIYIQKIQYSISKNKKLVLNLENQRKMILGF